LANEVKPSTSLLTVGLNYYAYFFAFSYLVHNIQAMDGAYSFCLNGVLINFPNDYL